MPNNPLFVTIKPPFGTLWKLFITTLVGVAVSLLILFHLFSSGNFIKINTTKVLVLILSFFSPISIYTDSVSTSKKDYGSIQ